MSLKEVTPFWKIAGISVLCVIVLLALIKAFLVALKVIAFLFGVALFFIPVAIIYFAYKAYKKYKTK